MKRLLLTLALTLSHNAFGGDVTSEIEYVQVVTAAGNSSVNFGVVKFESNPNNSPQCAGDPRMTIDFSEPGGTELFGLLLAAHMGSRTVHVWGTGFCTNDGNLETAAFARVF